MISIEKNLNVQNIDTQIFQVFWVSKAQLNFLHLCWEMNFIIEGQFWESLTHLWSQPFLYLQSEQIIFLVRFLGELFSLPENFENCWFLRAETEMENIPSPMSKIIYKILTLNLTRVYLTTLGFEGLSERGKTNFRKSIWDFFKGKEFQVGSIPFSKSPTKMAPWIQYFFRVSELRFSEFKSFLL